MIPAPVLGFLTSGPARWVALAVTVLVVVFIARLHWIQEGREQILRENAAVALKIVTKQGAVTTQVITRYIKAKADTDAAAGAVEKEVVRYVETNPAGLCIDAAWVRLHDAAAAHRLPAAP